MASLFPSREQGGERETGKTLPEDVRQLIVDLHTEAPFMSWREIAEICYIRIGRKPNHHSIKRIASTGPPPSLKARRYQPWHLIADSAERKLAAIRLHAEGWSITSIASYLECTRHTIYDTLKRWTDEGVAGLDEKPKTNKGVRKTTLQVRNEIRKLQEIRCWGSIVFIPRSCAWASKSARQRVAVSWQRIGNSTALRSRSANHAPS